MKNYLVFTLTYLLALSSAFAQSTSVKVWDGSQTLDITAANAAKVDGSAVTQPVSGTVTCNAGTNLNTSTLATSANQTTIIGHVDGIEGLLGTIDTDTGNIATSAASIDSKITACNTGAVTISTFPDNEPVNVAQMNGVAVTMGNGVSGTGVQRVTIASDSTGQVTCNAGTNLNTSSLALESGGNLAGSATSLAVIDDWDESDRAKVNPIVGQAGVAAGAGAVGSTTQRTTLASDDPAVTALQIIDDWDSSDKAKATLRPDTSGGLSITRFLDLDEADAAIKASAGQLYGYFLYNNAASTRFFKLYNATTGSVTVGSTAPVITIPVPAGSAANVEFSNGIAFSTAITAACTTGVADADTGAPGANDCVANFFYN